MALTPDQQALVNNLANYNYAAGYVPSTGGTSYNSTGQYSVTGDPTADRFWNVALGGVASLLGPDAGTAGDVARVLDPINSILPGAGFLFDSLFGGKKKATWNPYLDQNGNYFWTTPSYANPVPLSGIPGATITPSAEYQTMANQIRMITDLLPYYSQAISAQKIPDSLGQLAADTATTGPRLALQQQLQSQYGPAFDQLAAESNLRKSMASASNDAAVLAGPGQDLIKQALEAAKLYDPEYFQQRGTTNDAITKLIGQASANLGSGLSATERDEVGRGLALENSRRGTANAPSQLQTVANAMQFGQAGRQREMENQNQLSKAIAASTAFLPAAKTNVDVFQVATGKPSYAQQDNRFNTNTASNAADLAQGLLNTGASFWTTNANNNAAMALQNDQQKANQLGQITSALGSVGGLLLCWVAREVYGEQNPRWMKFREWLILKSPNWFFKWYANNGEEFAEYIKDKPLLKRIIRWWMDKRIKE